MNKENLSFSRRAMLQGTGALIVTFSAGGAGKALAQAAASDKPPLHPTELDSWIAIDPDGMVTVYFGKIDGGQGTDVGVAQMVAEGTRYSILAHCRSGPGRYRADLRSGRSEWKFSVFALAVLRSVTRQPKRCSFWSSVLQPNGVSAPISFMSSTVSFGIGPIRHTGSAMANWSAGIISKKNSSGTRHMETILAFRAGQRRNRPINTKIVGRDAPRFDVAGKVYGTTPFSTDVRVEGMLHGRMIRPQNAGTRPLSVDESSIAHIEGAQVVRRGDLIGVVAEKEWDAIRAATELAVTWSEPRDVFPEHDELYDHIRGAEPSRREVVDENGEVDQAFAIATQIIEAEYEWPFQSHASMGPGCAIADVREDGVTLWTGSQKPHAATAGVAAILGVPVESVHGIWNIGPGSYGRNDGGDVAMDAAVMSREVGRPVRVQWMRHEGTGWDPKGPSSIHRARAAVGADGNIIAWDFSL